jgi:long-chain acyl-CoA synthetase
MSQLLMPNPTLVHHFLEASALFFPEKSAVIHESVRTPYAEVNTKANALAHFLIQNNVSPGDRVAIFMENCLEYIVSYYATLKAAAISAPLNSELKPVSLRSILLQLKPKWIIATPRFERILQGTDLSDIGLNGLILKSPSLSWSPRTFPVEDLDGILKSKDLPNPAMDIQPGELASIIYTSGSTGGAKGVMLSHRNIVTNTLSICEYLYLTDSDIQMVILPFSYVMGKSLLNTHFAVGGTVVLSNTFAFPATVIKEMVAKEVTGFSGVPSTYAYLLHRSPLVSFREQLTSLRYCTQAGGHMSRATKQELQKVLPPHTEIYVMYGATEAAGRLTYLNPASYSEKIDSIGKAIPGVNLRILGEDGNDLPPGETGELVASGPNIMQGYWNDKDATSRALINGSYHTGDQAYQDCEGFFFIVGRKDDQLKVGGHKVNPHEIEDVLMQSGMLVETIVLGIQDALLGQRLVACIVTQNDCSQRDILSFCAEKLPKFKVPNSIIQVRSLPKNTSGKIDRTNCIELFNRKNSQCSLLYGKEHE